jgi:hypothetical protein
VRCHTRFVLALFLAGAALEAQPPNVLTITPSPRQQAKRNETLTAKVHAKISPGYHANSNKPNEDYLIPMKLTWKADPMEVVDVAFPKAQQEKYQFSEKPVSVFSGDFEITTTFKVPASATPGLTIVSGKLRYQACNDTMCLPPKTIDVPLTVEIR